MIVWLVASSPVVGAVVAAVARGNFSRRARHAGNCGCGAVACARVVMFDALRPPPARSRFAALACASRPPRGLPPAATRPSRSPLFFWRGSIDTLAKNEQTALWLVVASLLLWRGGGGSARGGGFGRAYLRWSIDTFTKHEPTALRLLLYFLYCRRRYCRHGAGRRPLAFFLPHSSSVFFLARQGFALP